MCGYNWSSVSDCYYDNKICTVGGVNGSDKSDPATGLTTEQCKAATGTTDALVDKLNGYMDETFFNENTTGTFLFPEGAKAFETLAVMKVSDSSTEIFKPSTYTRDLSILCRFIEENAAHISEEAFAKLVAAPGDWQVTALVTCTDGSTGTRLVLLVMTPYDKPDLPDDPDDPPIDPDDPDDPDDPTDPTDPTDPNPQTGDSTELYALLAIASCAVCVSMLSKKRRGNEFRK